MNRMRWCFRLQFLFLLTLTLGTLPTQGAMVRSLDLDQLSDQADRIFRGTVISLDHGTVEVGGGRVAVVVYRLEVSEAFKGSFDQENGQLFAELRMVASPEGDGDEGGEGATAEGATEGARRSRTFAFMPRLELGGEYLLMVTKPSAAGLSAPVGLGQGSFTIDGPGDQARVRNDFGNTGLSSGAPGVEGRGTAAEMTYRDLAERLHRSIQRSKRKEAVERVQR